MFTFIQMFAAQVVPTNSVPQTTGTSSLSYEMKEYYDTELLESARANLVFEQFAKKQALPGGRGKKVEWRKFSALNSTHKLKEGYTPDSSSLTVTHVEAEVEQYGDYVTVNDVLDMTAIDDVILAATEELGAEANKTYDYLVSSKLNTDAIGVTVYGENNGTPATAKGSVTAAHIVTPTVVNKAVTQLKKNNCPKIDGKYIAIVHPSVVYDLRQSTEWIDAHKYANPTEIYNGEVGELHGVRFIETTMAPVAADGSSSANVYRTFVFGKDAYGMVDLEGGSMELIVKALGSGGSADPLNQRQTIGWKGSQGCAVLDTTRIVCIMSGSGIADESDVTNYTVSITNDNV